MKYVEMNPAKTNPAEMNRFWQFQLTIYSAIMRSGRWSLNNIDDLPQELLLLLNFKI